MRRRINLKLLAILMVGGPLLGGGVHVLHEFQARKCAGGLLRRADRAEREGDLAEAEKELARYLGYEPKDVAAQARFGLLLARKAEDPKGSLRAFLILEQVLRRDPGRADVRRKVVDLAMDRANMARFSDARAHLEILLKSSPDDGELEDLLGQCLEADGDHAEAAAWYAKAIAHAPGRVECYSRLAALKRDRLGDPGGADRVMDAREVKDGVIAANGRSALAYMARGGYRRGIGDEKGAAEDVARALELAPDEAVVLLAAVELVLGKAEPGADDLDAARRHAAHGLELDPRDWRMFKALSLVEEKAGRPEEAEASLRRGAEAVDDPRERGELLVRLADLALARGDHDGAGRVIEQLREAGIDPDLLKYFEAQRLVAAQKWPEAAEALEDVHPLVLANWPGLAYRLDLLLARSYEQLGEADKRLAVLRRAVTAEPLGPAGLMELGRALAAEGQVDQAIDTFAKVADRVPEARVTRARLLVVRTLRQPEGRRDWREAVQALDGAAEALPDSPDVAILRAEALAAQGQADRARALLGEAIAKHPEIVAFRTALAALDGRGARPEAALADLDEAERRLGVQVDLDLARVRYWTRRGGDEAKAALARLEEGLDRLPVADRPRLLGGLADAHARLGDDAQAARLYRRAVALRPDDLAARIALFDLALRADDGAALTALVGEIKAAEDRAGDREGLLWRYGQAAYLIWTATRGKSDQQAADRAALGQARTLLVEVIRRRPNWTLAVLGRAEVDDLLGEVDGAIGGYLRAIELGERRPAVIERAARLLLARGRAAEADRAIDRLRDDDPGLGGNPALRQLAAEVALRMDDPERALKLARAAAAPRSGDYRDHLWLGRMLTAVGRRAEAGPPLGRAVELAPDEPDVWVAWVQHLAAAGQKEKAGAAIEQARKRLPKDAAPLALARCYAAAGRVDEARTQYKAALEARPDDVDVLGLAASYAGQTGDLAQAEGLFRKILGHRGTPPAVSTWARDNLAMVVAAKGDYQQSKQALTLVGLPEDIETYRPGEGERTEDLRARARALAMQRGRAPRLAAIRILEQVVGRGSPAEDDQFLLAQLEATEKDWRPYRERMQALLAARGENPLYLAHYVRSLLEQRDFGGAAPWLDTLERLQPGAAATLELRARWLAAQDRAGEAAAILRKYARGRDAEAGRVAALLEELGRPTEAEELYRRYVAVAQAESPEAALVLATFLGRRGRVPEALDLCDRAWASCRPEAVAAASVQVLYAARSADDDQCLRVERRLDEAIRKAPDQVSFQFDRANLLIARGRYRESEEVLRRLAAGGKAAAGALNNLAWLIALQEEEGRGDEALGLIDRAIALDGPVPDFLDTRGLVHLAQGRSDRAIKDLADAVALNPTAEKYFHLARAYLAGHDRQKADEALREAEGLRFKAADLHPLERPSYRKLFAELARN